MIQANELRVGNLINNHREPEQVNLWHLQVADKNEYFTPIQLTPEILEKCGFEKHSSFHPIWKIDFIWYTIGEGNVTLSAQSKDNKNLIIEEVSINSFDGEDNSCTPVKCLHLHQLQNLYFALTGTELNYTPCEQ